jgi:uncharacterized cupredoxin-like copper-binding protein
MDTPWEMIVMQITPGIGGKMKKKCNCSILCGVRYPGHAQMGMYGKIIVE